MKRALLLLCSVTLAVLGPAHAFQSAQAQQPRAGAQPVPGASQLVCPTGQHVLEDRCVEDGEDPDHRSGNYGNLSTGVAAGVVAGALLGRSFAARTSDARRLVPVRMYLPAPAIPPRGIGAYGVVALRGLPTPATRARLWRLCQSFVKYLPRPEAIPNSVRRSDWMVTVWPLTQPEAAPAKKDDCDFVIDHYDLYGGISAIQDAELQGADLSGPGPFLIGWSPASSRGVKDKVVLTFDMSSLDSQESFDRAFIWWQQRVVSDPKLWRHGWSVEAIRLSVRDFFDRYGESALNAIRFFGGK
jgi:hypothetical protein